MTPTPPLLRRCLPWLGLALLLAATWLAYLPGLHGGFLFDDFVNLPALGATGPVDDWATFWRYLTSGTADPTGRPLALLTFLLDANNWPADPAPFLRTNVLLHLLNAALLFALLRQLGRRLDGGDARAHRRRTDAAALLGAGLWALHPLWVSTTLYIVQREAMLPVSFILLGLLAWGRGRRLLATAPRAGTAWMVFGIGLGTLLAVLSKANGALLPLLALVLEATVWRGEKGAEKGARGNFAARNFPLAPFSPRLRMLQLVLLVLPSLAIGAYLLARLQHLGVDLASRPWTLGERLLTEPRVLLDYLRLLLVPQVLSTGLYNDGYAWSTGLLHPVATLPALLGVLALVAAGFALRRRAPALSAALLFYFAGHLLESTTVPLELYFEHRNYLPALLLGWPLARVLCRWRVPAWVRAAVAAVLLALLATTTWQRASLWANQPLMARLWAAQNPGSSRAQATAALFDMHAGRPRAAMARLAPHWRAHPHDLQLALNYLNAACQAGGPATADIDAVANALQHATEGDQLVHRWLGKVLDAASAGRCPGVTTATVARWTRAALANPRLATMPGRQQDLRSLLGRLALQRGDAATALAQFNRALDAWPTPQAAAMQSALLASAGHPAQGLQHLDHYAAIAGQRKRASGYKMARVHAWVLRRQGYWPHEFAELRRKMHEDLAAQAAPATTR